jgi:hypothetical protein
MNVHARNNGDGHGGHFSQETAMLVKPIDSVKSAYAHCFQGPHYVLGTAAVAFGFLLVAAGLGGIVR